MVASSPPGGGDRTNAEETNRKNMTADDESLNVTGFPPIHSIAFIATMIGVSLWYLPPMEEIDQVATVKTFTRSLFPQFLTPAQVGLIRLFFAFYVGYLAMLQLTGDELLLNPNYLPGSKLKRNKTFRIRGFKYASAFTVWSWYLLGFHFACSGAIPLWDRYLTEGAPVPSWLLRCALLSFEVAAPCSMLTTTVVTYALWPQALRSGKVDHAFKRPYALHMHNMNSAMVLVEAAILGGIPVLPAHCTLGPIWGGCFVVYAWVIRYQWTKTEPHFLYFFLDTTLPRFLPTIFLLALLLVLLVFYVLFCAGTVFLFNSSTEPVFVYNVVVAFVVLASVCKFRD